MKIAILGCGNMGGAIARGIASDPILSQIYELSVSNRSAGKLDGLKNDCPSVTTHLDNCKAVEDADVVILAVKPWIVEPTLAEIRPLMNNQALVTVAAGLPISFYEERMPEGLPVFRVIPNTAASIGESMTVIAHNAVGAGKVDTIKAIFNALGKTEVIEERLMGAATSLCSCGTAYILRYVRAAMEGGVELGLYPDQAKEMVIQTVKGAVELLEKSGLHPEAEIDKVTTPGGLTIKGLNKMEQCGFTTAVIEGLKASVK